MKASGGRSSRACGRSGRPRSARSGRRSGRRRVAGRAPAAAVQADRRVARGIDGRHRRAAGRARRWTWGEGSCSRTPVLAASGSMGYGVEVADAVDLARLGGLVTRGTTLKPRAGHPAPRTADIPAGLLLGIGLQNPGIESVLERYARRVGDVVRARDRQPVRRERGRHRRHGATARGRRRRSAGLELNLSCANGSRGAFGLDEGAAGLARRRPSAGRRTCRSSRSSPPPPPTCARSPVRSRTPAPTRSARSTRCPGSRSTADRSGAGARERLRRRLRAGAQAARAAGRVGGRAGRWTSRSSASAG